MAFFSPYWHNFFRLTTSGGGGGIIIFIFGALSFKVLDEMGKLFQGRIFSGPPPPAAPYFSLCTREKHMEQQVFWLKKCLWWNMQHLVFSVLFFSSLWRWHGNIALWLRLKSVKPQQSSIRLSVQLQTYLFTFYIGT